MIPLTHTAFLRVVDASALLSRAMRLECASMATFDTEAVPTRGGSGTGGYGGILAFKLMLYTVIVLRRLSAAGCHVSRWAAPAQFSVLHRCPHRGPRLGRGGGGRCRQPEPHERVRAAARHRFFKCYSLRS